MPGRRRAWVPVHEEKDVVKQFPEQGILLDELLIATILSCLLEIGTSKREDQSSPRWHLFPVFLRTEYDAELLGRPNATRINDESCGGDLEFTHGL